MSYLNEDIIKAIKAARVAKGLNQRELSTLVGLPQSYISKVENGMVDIGLSTLIAFSRALDMEVTLIPRRAVPAVESVIESVKPQRRFISDKPVWVSSMDLNSPHSAKSLAERAKSGLSSSLEEFSPFSAKSLAERIALEDKAEAMKRQSIQPKYRLDDDND